MMQDRIYNLIFFFYVSGGGVFDYSSTSGNEKEWCEQTILIFFSRRKLYLA